MSAQPQQLNSLATEQLDALPLPDDVVLSVRGVSKKFCKHLRRSMAYGILDLSKNLLGLRPDSSALRKSEFWALEDVSFELHRGECLGLIGVNGSGKTTLLRLIAGIFPPDKGEIAVKGRVGSLIALGAGFHPHMTGRENVYLNGAVLGMGREEIRGKFQDIADFADIGDFIDAPVSTYSSGMRVRLGFAVAAHTDPDLLLVDEVIAVGDVGFRMKCYDHIRSLVRKGTSVILVTHQVGLLDRVTDQVAVLDKGHKVFDGPLGHGVGMYHHLCEAERAGETQGGQKDAWIESVQLMGDDGEEKDTFMTGDTIVVQICLGSRRRVPDARLIANLHSPINGEIGSVSTPYKGFSFDLTPPETTIRLKLLEVPLLVGGYSMHLTLNGPEITDFYDIRRPAARFRIVGPPTNTFGYGVCHTFLFDHQWEQL